MAKRTKRSAIVPKIVRGTVAIGVIPIFTATSGCSASQPPPVVAAIGPEDRYPTPPVVAAMATEPMMPVADDAGPPDASTPEPADGGPKAQGGPLPSPVVAAYIPRKQK
jgi:hypothetical protein